MILQALVKYYEDLAKQDKAARKGWCQSKVFHAIELNEDGTIKTIISLKTEEERGKKKVWVPVLLNVPEMVTRSLGVNSNFLCDNAKYILGIDDEEITKRPRECFLAAREKHLSILGSSDGIMAKAICSYFEKWNPEKAKEDAVVKAYWDELNEGGNIVFSIRGKFAQDDEEIKAMWETRQDQDGERVEGTCLVTRERTEIARIHRGIKGVPGAQSSGASLVSFNEKSFESYGKEQSYNAPVGKYAEFAYTTALNYLLNQREYRFQLGDSMVVFWAESGEEGYQKTFLEWLNPKKDNQEEMEKIFGNLKKGLHVDLSDIHLNPEQKFYILCLAPNAARLSVRFFYQNSFEKILENLGKHYKRLDIVRPQWEDLSYLGINKMLNETVNQKSKDKTPVPNMAAMVLKAILDDTRYPESLYTDTLIRIRAEQGNVTGGRAGIIKAILIKNYNWKEGEEYMGLNEECTESAYVLGRIFAVLEFIQKDANPGINTTIRDKYFNSACATPGSVFPILIKLKNSHLKKVEREDGGKKIFYEKSLTELINKLHTDETGFPRRLSLEEQGKFILGYYHQVQKKYEKKEEK